MTLDERLREILTNYAEKVVLGDYKLNEKLRANAIFEIKALVRESVPEIKRAHTYASENAGIYRAYDGGQRSIRKEMLDKWA